MCNINVVYKKDGKNSTKVIELMNAMSLVSYLSNNDGEGYISIGNDFKVAKSSDKIIYRTPCSFLATHQRIATSGKNNDNIHPFDVGNIILMHNGIISGYGNEKVSDTKQYAIELSKEYDKTGDLVLSIKNIEITGSFSILVYDKIYHRFLYYKNGSTSMTVLDDEDYLVMSTNPDNVSYAKDYLQLKNKGFTPISYTIYDVLNDFNPVDTMKVPAEPKFTYNAKGGYWFWDEKRAVLDTFDPFEKYHWR